ncbi:tRNA (adenosine(37)-N6)-dimethylallyltransferase MiaA [Synechococcus sp. CBW1108]|nr:tRNA (adenosine(37)-N6)-dimethylallyltransferase MiaA [Synechococcus sp. CBW1108]QPN71532.1 tRNA (adenosine(37)-N6)-dimethylallyltransferase MiaA [Synechococcus sp. CBW1108]
MAPNQPLVIVLLGPTASGKTDLAIALARALDLAVLNVDSRQLYRQMDVGTAKPTAAQRAQARHELLDLRDPDQPLNLQEFRAIAEAQLNAELARKPLALLAGGSGLYLQAITQGMNPPAVPPQPQLRAQLAALGQPLCHQLLRQGDPVAAGRIAATDAVRTQRALEVLYATGRPLSEQQGATPPPWRLLELGLNPANLEARIAERTRALYGQGLVAETEALIGRYGPELPLLDTIGYAEARQLLAGTLTAAEAGALTQLRTRQFAKRQRTWFRRRHRPCWLGGEGEAEGEGEAALLKQALQEVERGLG